MLTRFSAGSFVQAGPFEGLFMMRVSPASVRVSSSVLSVKATMASKLPVSSPGKPTVVLQCCELLRSGFSEYLN